MRLAIVGSRICTPIDIASHLSAKPDVVVSGGAAGVDTYAKEYARLNEIPIVEYLPDYKRYGRRAPICFLERDKPRNEVHYRLCHETRCSLQGR